MNEADARAVRRMQTLEAQPAAGSAWTDDHRRRASEAARRVAGAKATPAQFIVARAHQVQLLRGAAAARDPRAWLSARLTVAGVVVVAIAVGAAADGAAPGQRIDLLSPPWLAVLGWNLLVYIAIGLRSLWRAAPRRDALAVLDARRIERLLHLAALALALGLCLGLYARGLVLDYRAGWQSTFLDAPQVHGLLSLVLAPAAAVTGIAVPDADAVAALRIAPALAASAPAAGWIHLLATTLLLIVVLPRGLLAAFAHWRSGRLAADLPLDLQDPYFRQLAREIPGPAGPAVVRVVPYAIDPPAPAALAAALGEALGRRVAVAVAPALAFGDEDAALAPEGDGALFALFALSATPESEHHGTLLSRLAPGKPAVLIDESAFRLRFADDPQRIEARRAAWREFALAHGGQAQFIDLALAVRE